MGSNKSRKVKVEWMKEVIHSFWLTKPGKAISKEVLISEFALAHDSTERTAKEILKLLATSKYILINGDEILKGVRK